MVDRKYSSCCRLLSKIREPKIQGNLLSLSLSSRASNNTTNFLPLLLLLASIAVYRIESHRIESNRSTVLSSRCCCYDPQVLGAAIRGVPGTNGGAGPPKGRRRQTEGCPRAAAGARDRALRERAKRRNGSRRAAATTAPAVRTEWSRPAIGGIDPGVLHARRGRGCHGGFPGRCPVGRFLTPCVVRACVRPRKLSNRWSGAIIKYRIG